jgi:ribose transport system ATP-binding protein
MEVTKAGEVRLSALGVAKRFGPTRALAGVDLVVRAGEIHALLGANGSGKSTLIKILGGVQPADEGRFQLGGAEIPADALTPTVSHAAGLRFVHQAESLFESMTVAENLAGGFGFVCRRSGRINWPKTRRRARDLLDRFGIDARPDQELTELRPATRKLIACARALQDELADETPTAGKVLVLDEPTAALQGRDVNLLHEVLERCAALGEAVIYVTHRLEELPGFAHRATVLRDGRVSGVIGADELTHDRLTGLITGSAPVGATSASQRHPSRGGQPLLELDGLGAGPLESVDLSVRAGEIVGLAGLEGSGRSTILRACMGGVAPRRGTVRIAGAPLPPGRFHADVAYVPADRTRDAAFEPLTLGENLQAKSLSKFWRQLRLHGREERASSVELIQRFSIKAASVDVPFKTLSGGNQQKAILARWLCRSPRVLLLDEPTQGVDVGARNEIHQLIRAGVASDAAALVASSDFEELASLCDRVIVLRGGRVAAEVDTADVDRAHLEQLTFGKDQRR